MPGRTKEIRTKVLRDRSVLTYTHIVQRNAGGDPMIEMDTNFQLGGKPINDEVGEDLLRQG